MYKIFLSIILLSANIICFGGDLEEGWNLVDSSGDVRPAGTLKPSHKVVVAPKDRTGDDSSDALRLDDNDSTVNRTIVMGWSEGYRLVDICAALSSIRFRCRDIFCCRTRKKQDKKSNM